MKAMLKPNTIRMIDCTIATSLLLAGLLPAVLTALFLRGKGQHVIRRQLARRSDGSLFEVMHWQGPLLPATYLTLVNVLLGDLTLGGTGVIHHEHRKTSIRKDYQPSLVSRAGLRARTGMVSAADTHTGVTSTTAYLGLLLRNAFVAACYRKPDAQYADRIAVMGVSVDNTTVNEAVDRIVANSHAPRSVAFVNAHSLNLAWGNPAFKQTLNAFDLRLVDGSGVRLACQMRNQPLRDNVNGTDLLPPLVARCAASGRSIFLYGARPGVAIAMADRLQMQYPDLHIAGVLDGYQHNDPQQVVAVINACTPHIVLVALGSPLQEQWIQQWGHHCDCNTLIAVGGLFDFYSGRARRAPEWLRELGLEWTWRLLQEPKRLWKRYVVGNPAFLVRSFIAMTFGRD